MFPPRLLTLLARNHLILSLLLFFSRSSVALGSSPTHPSLELPASRFAYHFHFLS